MKIRHSFCLSGEKVVGASTGGVSAGIRSGIFSLIFDQRMATAVPRCSVECPFLPGSKFWMNSHRSYLAILRVLLE